MATTNVAGSKIMNSCYNQIKEQHQLSWGQRKPTRASDLPNAHLILQLSLILLQNFYSGTWQWLRSWWLKLNSCIINVRGSQFFGLWPPTKSGKELRIYEHILERPQSFLPGVVMYWYQQKKESVLHWPKKCCDVFVCATSQSYRSCPS